MSGILVILNDELNEIDEQIAFLQQEQGRFTGDKAHGAALENLANVCMMRDKMAMELAALDDPFAHALRVLRMAQVYLGTGWSSDMEKEWGELACNQPCSADVLLANVDELKERILNAIKEEEHEGSEEDSK